MSENWPEAVPQTQVPHCEAHAGLATAHGSAPTPEPAIAPARTEEP